MEIGQSREGGVEVLAPVGRLDTDSSADFELAVHDLLAAGARHVVVDLAGVSYVSSAGLRVLLMLAKRVGDGGSLRLAGLNPQVQQVFDIAGFSTLFAVFADRGAALAGHPAAAASAPAVAPAAAADETPEAAADDLSVLAARLMGAEGSTTPASGDPAAADVARAAAQLLGAQPAAKPAGKRGAPTPSAAPPPTAAVPPAATPPAKKPGFFARLFGRKG